MPIMPYLGTKAKSTNMIAEFGGYNHNNIINENEFYDMKNFSSYEYPVASTRKHRGQLTFTYQNGSTSEAISEVIGICPKEYINIIFKRTVSSQNELWIGIYDFQTQKVTHGVKLSDYTSGKHQVVEMGAYIIVFPELVRVNTAVKNSSGNYSEIDNLDVNTDLPSAQWRLCDYNGNFYDTGTASAKSPSNPTDGYLWLDTSVYPSQPKVWSESISTWTEFTPYIRIWFRTPGSGVLDWSEGDAAEIFINTGSQHRVYEDNILQCARGQKYFVIAKKGDCDENGVEGTGLYSFLQFQCSSNSVSTWGGRIGVFTFKRSIPKMDYIVECNNRLWGCRYGNNNDGEMVNEIFACKLGDPKNWHYFSNTTVDSYYVSLGDDGAFTGAITYQDNPIFFREDCFHRIYGSYPSNFQLSTMRVKGVKKGSSKSLSILNEVLYYHSPIGFMAYSGGIPVNISKNLGNEIYHDAVAGSLGNILHISCKDRNNNPIVLCFNDYYQQWHKEDATDITDFIIHVDEKYALTSDYELFAVECTRGVKEDNFEWYIESGNIGFIMPTRKRLLKLVMRLWLNRDTNAAVMINYDDSEWEHISFLRPMGRIVSVPLALIPHRCDHFRIRIEGKGDFRLLGISKYLEEASIYD